MPKKKMSKLSLAMATKMDGGDYVPGICACLARLAPGDVDTCRECREDDALADLIELWETNPLAMPVPDGKQ